MNSGEKTGVGKRPRDTNRLILATLIPPAAFVLQWIFWNSFKPFAWIFFYPAVFFSAWVGGLRCGLASITFSTLVIWWFFIPNRYSFIIEHPAYAFTMLVFTSMGVLFSFTFEWLRKANQQAADALAAVSSAKDQLEEQVSQRTTELAQTIAALRASEEQYRLIVENSEDWIYWIAPDGTLPYISPSCESMTGYSMAEFYQNPQLINEMVHHEDRATFLHHSENMRDERKPDYLEYRIITNTGETLWISHSCAPLYTPDGGYIGRRGTNRNITTRKQIEVALQESEERMRLLGDNLPDSYVYQYIHDADGTSRFLYLSAGVESLHGVSREEVLRDAGLLHQQVDSEQMSILMAMEAASLQSMSDFGMELRICRTDGEWRWIQVRSHPHRKTNGQVLWDGVATDITERKRAEVALRESEARTRNVFDQANDGIYIISAENRYLDVNEGGLELLGYSHDELLQLSVADVLAPHEVARLAVEPPLMMSGEHHLDEWVHVRKDGTTFLGEVSARRLNDNSYLAIVRDLSDRKNMENNLRNLNRTQAMRSNVSQLIVRMLKPQELYETTCRIAVEIGGFRMAWIGLLDMQTKHMVPVAHAGVVDDYLEKLNISLDGSERGHGPTATALRTGHHVMVNNISRDPLMAPWRADALRLGYLSAANFPFIVGGEVIGALVLYAGEPDLFTDDELSLLDELAADITFALEFAEHDEKRKQAEEQIRRLNEELEERVRERTAQLEAVNRELETFSYSVSHDLKAPLRGIDGYSQLLEKDYSDRLDDEGRLFIRNIRHSAGQMHQLIEDLLHYSRMERRSVQNIRLDLAELVKAVVAEREAEVKQAGVQLRLEVPTITVHADRDGLAVVLRNLLENALKFSGTARPPTVDIGARREEGKVILWVRDNGIGFDMKFHDRIFEIFQRLQRSEDYPGTGIGLALVRKAMGRMGGRVWAESSPGGGATFFLEIPL